MRFLFTVLLVAIRFFACSIFISLYPERENSRASTPSCKLNKSTFVGGRVRARALEIENIRHFRQSQFIRRFQSPDSYIQFSSHPPMAAAAVPPSGKTRSVRRADRFTVKFTRKFASAAHRRIFSNASLPNLLPVSPSFLSFFFSSFLFFHLLFLHPLA